MSVYDFSIELPSFVRDTTGSILRPISKIAVEKHGNSLLSKILFRVIEYMTLLLKEF